LTLNDLIKKIPEDLRDCFIVIYIPCVRAEDEENYPLIEVSIDQMGSLKPIIILEADI